MKKEKKNFAQKAYQSTAVTAEHTQTNIVKMLEALGITETRITTDGSKYTVEFIVRLRHNESPRKVRINVPLDANWDEEMPEERKRDIIFRVFYWHLKDRFVAVNNGLKEFEDEFLPDLVVVSNGEEIRLADMLIPRYKEMLKDQKMAVFSLKSGDEE